MKEFVKVEGKNIKARLAIDRLQSLEIRELT
jgi:hypothetical protein